MKAQKVAFVCLHGSAKSLIAAEYFNRLAAEKSLPLRATTADGLLATCVAITGDSPDGARRAG